jgi:hypothetical protein
VGAVVALLVLLLLLLLGVLHVCYCVCLSMECADVYKTAL